MVEVPNENAQNSTQWAIASDGMWLLPIPDRDSEAGRRTNSKVYEDAEMCIRDRGSGAAFARLRIVR